MEDTFIKKIENMISSKGKQIKPETNKEPIITRNYTEDYIDYQYSETYTHQ